MKLWTSHMPRKVMAHWLWWLLGIYGNVYLSGAVVSNWTSYRLPLTYSSLSGLKFSPVNATPPVSSTPTFYRAKFTITPQQGALHSFLRINGWGYGVIFVNGFNIGRFSCEGPQMTLYVPSTCLAVGSNDVVVFESYTPIMAPTAVRTLTFVNDQEWLGGKR